MTGRGTAGGGSRARSLRSRVGAVVGVERGGWGRTHGRGAGTVARGRSGAWSRGTARRVVEGCGRARGRGECSCTWSGAPSEAWPGARSAGSRRRAGGQARDGRDAGAGDFVTTLEGAPPVLASTRMRGRRRRRARRPRPVGRHPRGARLRGASASARGSFVRGPSVPAPGAFPPVRAGPRGCGASWGRRGRTVRRGARTRSPCVRPGGSALPVAGDPRVGAPQVGAARAAGTGRAAGPRPALPAGGRLRGGAPGLRGRD